ncbi:MAG: Competence protein ComEC [Microgenomates group bacterium GW2011_GWC1_46_16]|uniref:ComEC/Rec2-related protein domain-containing protein n=2 Tax=Candidatus Collieribacteriota TaxID=1752725 RepID=A0A1F5G039_9BACT|nr:MAG: Competence protein ComEC [Microgenomates group bacterium GW2011_GWC1_46_16]KKU62241.1 MAG: Competence protein ComEC [Microgenomates group bacterium GW2011_GWD1_47_13]OGD70496.1 MAG: hypothetical protein A2187_01930 [Candidatus Collierbacteria bacterium RIFOXYA1_FULL_46_24]OGD75449.1 MAG: hypothetical protein A2228_01705 [Candidatus Collierbacteria bacterium RIFOXYA2_FULL_46_10]OGD85174.1 MAG: hypothetical protein A2618_00465 [Candidatus Collierbacteria bacterium RIFOXYD1_FULL_46_26]HBD
MKSKFSSANLGMFVILLIILWLRWVSLPKILPTSWTPESVVSFTAPILDKPEQTESNVIIRQGRWYIKLKSDAGINQGDKVRFVGSVIPLLLGGKERQIKMMDPNFEIIERENQRRLSLIEVIQIGLGKWRKKWVTILEKTLPEPMSSLGAGILLGVRGEMPREFYDQLVATGTLHVIAASGFNVMIVAGVLMSLFKRWFSRGVATIVGITGIGVYVGLAGGSASVVRAGIMGSLTLMAYFWGRPTEAKRLLWVAAYGMLLINPLLIADVGWQLSVSATAGLLYLEPKLHKVKVGLGAEYIYPTVAASVATAPIIWWHFGRVAWISPIVNLLILPIVPLIMLLAAVVVGAGSLSMRVGQVIGWILYVPLWWMVRVIEWWGNL